MRRNEKLNPDFEPPLRLPHRNALQPMFNWNDFNLLAKRHWHHKTADCRQRVCFKQCEKNEDL